MVNKSPHFIPISNIVLSNNEEKYVTDAVRSSWISSLGKYVNQFESDFASYLGVQHAVTVSNGTVALHLALKALDIGPGDEVIVPSLTFAATVNAVLHAGAVPVLVDSLPDHWNMDPAEVERAVSPATKAIIPVHLYGHPCDMDAIMEIADKYKLYVIEDAAEAHGAECQGKKVGGLGHIGCFSFYGNKVITTGEGGMCVTNDAQLNDRMRRLRDHGMSKSRRYWHEEVGFNYRLTNLNAAIGVAQLEQIDVILARRAQIATLYENGSQGIRGLLTISESPHGKKIDWLFCVFIDELFPMNRDALILKLKEYNADARPTFYPVHIMPPYQNLKKIGELRNSSKFGLSGINLPLYPTLADEDVHYIVKVLKYLSVQ